MNYSKAEIFHQGLKGLPGNHFLLDLKCFKRNTGEHERYESLNVALLLTYGIGAVLYSEKRSSEYFIDFADFPILTP